MINRDQIAQVPVEKITALDRDLSDAKWSLRRTVAMLVARGEKLENISAKSDALAKGAEDFGTRKIRWQLGRRLLGITGKMKGLLSYIKAKIFRFAMVAKANFEWRK